MKSIRLAVAALCTLGIAACSGAASVPSRPEESAARVPAPLSRHIALPITSATSRSIRDATGALADPGFESGALTIWQQCGSVNAAITTAKAHTGTHSEFSGTTAGPETNGDAGVCQSVKIPAAGGNLTFWVFQGTNETSTTFAYQEADLLDSTGAVVTNFYTTAAKTTAWVQKSFSVTVFAGQTLYIYFGVHGDGFSTGFVNQYVDDVAFSAVAPTPTPVPTATPTPTPVPVPTPTPTPLPPTPTPTPTATPVPAGPTPIATPAGQLSQTCGVSCGVERWHIKTLDDAFTKSINWTPKLVSVSFLTGQPVPTGFTSSNDTTRYSPVEDTTYTVRGTLVGWKTETDHDYHIVIADTTNPAVTMIIEPPDPTCTDACASNFGSFYTSVRAKLSSCFGQPPTAFTNFKAGITVDVTGVGFFDVLHGQTGVAPNGIELHPLLSVKFVSGQPAGC